MTIDDFVSVKEAAQIIGCAEAYVRQLYLKWERQNANPEKRSPDVGLPGIEPNGRCIMLSRQYVEKFAETPSVTGRPRSCRAAI